MGLLNEGKSLSHQETMKYAEHVRKHGLIQFINQYRRFKGRKGDPFKWGDEIEYTIIRFFEDRKEAKLCLRNGELLAVLNEQERTRPDEIRALWRPEYGAYMIEGTPTKPFGGLETFGTVEANMKGRREEIGAHLKENEAILCVTCFPRLGCENFTDPPYKPTPSVGVSGSLFYPDEAINQVHPRWKNTTNNIMERRGEKPYTNLPVFRDVNTKIPIDDTYQRDENAAPDCIYMDTMGFGGGFCCLQATFQGSDLDQARFLYDQLTPFCPIMVALAASSPIYRGFLSETDARWDIISGCTDCRTEEERGLKPLKNNKLVLKKPRYSSVDCYLSPANKKYNDISVDYRQEDFEQLRKSGVDEMLAEHIANLFVRDTISLFSEKIHQNDEEERDHYENILSTNWRSMRLKLPVPEENIGWRVEFRPMDVQMTDFENAAYVCFVVLLTRVILHYKLNFMMPISKVDENFSNCQKRDAIKTTKFWFRQNIQEEDGISDAENKPTGVIVQMTINEIMNGKGEEFPGIIPLARRYLEDQKVDSDTSKKLNGYFDLLAGRASGKIMTVATWMRKFVREHPEYKQDSVVTERICYDLLKTVQRIQNGEPCTELLGQKVI
ncbi:unnamed protein product [Phaedon cochleariae]|uniref:Glutamate--cysteine ligase n=1 Tax=Phaedon cochleariae TaxID=80249 RepID=A0A9P0DJ27_PHACE|nr:unnamed protein product [Phaedon cochleariae]